MKIATEKNNTVFADNIKEKLISVRRTAKVVKGGRIFGFVAVMVIGDGNGRIGLGMGKSREVPQAIQKAIEKGRRSMIKIALKDQHTIQHPIVGCFGASKVILIPASVGTGLIAGGAVRAVCEVLGIKDILAKCVGSRNPINASRATLEALSRMHTIEYVNAKRHGFNS